MVDDEFGDSWLYGASSDPRKLALFRLFMRARRRSKNRTKRSPSRSTSPESRARRSRSPIRRAKTSARPLSPTHSGPNSGLSSPRGAPEREKSVEQRGRFTVFDDENKTAERERERHDEEQLDHRGGDEKQLKPPGLARTA